MSRHAAVSSRKLALAGFLVCAGLIGCALYLQYQRGLEPCPLCMIQRIGFIALGGVFLAAALHGPKRWGMRVYGLLASVLALGGASFAARHVWLQWHPPDMEACTADLFYQLLQSPVFAVVENALRATGDCAKVDWRLLGLSIAEWSLVWFILLSGIALVLLLRRAAPGRGRR